MTVMELSLCIMTLILLQNPARASSMLLSTTSYTRWCRPLRVVSPMYMEGLFLTALRPSITWMSLAPYSLFSAFDSAIFQKYRRDLVAFYKKNKPAGYINVAVRVLAFCIHKKP